MTAKAPSRFASSTVIESEKTEMEIKKYLRSRGAENPVVTQDDDHNQIVVMFRMFGRVIQMRQNLPVETSKFIQRPLGFRAASASDIKTRMVTETRRKWRVMLTRVKVRLDLVFEEEDMEEREAAFRYEFLTDTAIPGGGTVVEFMEPQVAEAYATGKPPQMLPPPVPYKALEGGK